MTVWLSVIPAGGGLWWHHGRDEEEEEVDVNLPQCSPPQTLIMNRESVGLQLSCSLSLSVSPSCSLGLARSLSLAHSLSRSCSLALALSLSLTHSLVHAHSLSLAHAHSRSLSLSPLVFVNITFLWSTVKMHCRFKSCVCVQAAWSHAILCSCAWLIYWIVSQSTIVWLFFMLHRTQCKWMGAFLSIIRAAQNEM